MGRRGRPDAGSLGLLNFVIPARGRVGGHDPDECFNGMDLSAIAAAWKRDFARGAGAGFSAQLADQRVGDFLRQVPRRRVFAAQRRKKPLSRRRGAE